MIGAVRRWFGRRVRCEPEADANQGGVNLSSEVDYIGLAGLLIDRHGPAARAEAVRLTQEALQEEDAEAVVDWRAVEQAIALLTSDFAGMRH